MIAELLDIHRNRVYALAKDGTIPSFKIGGVRRFDVAEVLASLRER